MSSERLNTGAGSTRSGVKLANVNTGNSTSPSTFQFQHNPQPKMSFQHHLDGLLTKGKAKLKEYTDQHQSPNAPPPVPYSTKPRGSSQAPSTTAYWQGAFNPSTPVSQIFEQETGAHGWGNNESQNYTNDPKNSFFTPDGKLVLRGIVQSGAGDKYTSARLISHQKLDRQRGCLTAVLSPPCAEGIWPAFWLLPSKPFTWPSKTSFRSLREVVTD